MMTTKEADALKAQRALAEIRQQAITRFLYIYRLNLPLLHILLRQMALV